MYGINDVAMLTATALECKIIRDLNTVRQHACWQAVCWPAACSISSSRYNHLIVCTIL
jgi:hypothetical protein